MVGKVIKAVHDAGMDDNTMIIFTSDNGCSPAANFSELAKFGHNPSYVFRGTKSDIWEGGHRIPFIVKWPGKTRQHSICDSTICLTDLMATCASLLNKKIPANAGEDSYDLMPLLLNKGKYQRANIIMHSIDGFFAIEKDKWKLELCAGSGGWSSPTEKTAAKLKLFPLQLYNMKEDIGEKNNLAEQYPDKIKELTLLMEQIIKAGRTTKGKVQKNDVEIDYKKQK